MVLFTCLFGVIWFLFGKYSVREKRITPALPILIFMLSHILFIRVIKNNLNLHLIYEEVKLKGKAPGFFNYFQFY